MSTTFTVTRDQIIQLALRKLAVLELGDTPDAATIANASLALNLLIKQMSTEGLKIWKINEVTLPLEAGKNVYTIGPSAGNDLITDKPLKVIQAWLRNNTVSPPIDTPMQLLSKQEYNLLGSKQSQGVANSMFYDVRQNNGEMHVYLEPNSFVEDTYELHFVCQQPLADVNRAQDIPEFPNEWMNTLVWNLADQLAIEYAVPANHRMEIAARAKTYKEQLTDWDVEVTSTFFQPDFRSRNFRYGNVP